VYLFQSVIICSGVHAVIQHLLYSYDDFHILLIFIHIANAYNVGHSVTDGLHFLEI